MELSGLRRRGGPAMIRVERGIPLPPPGHAGKPSGRTNLRYPWGEMQRGDSFFVPSARISRGSLEQSCSRAAKEQGRRYALRAVPGGWRVWRIA